MACFDYDDLSERLEAIGYSKESVIHTTILTLAATLDNEELNDSDKLSVLSLFSSEAISQLNELPFSVLSRTSWRDFDYGNTPIGAFVRVRKDAYDSNTGKKHNGKVGILKDMRARRCKVSYIGDTVTPIMEHPMENLETLSKV